MISKRSTIFTTNTLQAPAVYLEILGVQFGLADFEAMKNIDITKHVYERPRTPKSLVKFPNLITSVKSERITDDYNKYTITLRYQPGDNEDPNYIDKLLSANATQNDSIIRLAYGDASSDGYFTRKMEAAIRKYSMSLDTSSATMTYTLSAEPVARSVTVAEDGSSIVAVPFPALTGKFRISLIIKKLWNDESTYGFQSLFPGGIWIDDIHISDITEENAPDMEIQASDDEFKSEETSPISYLIKLVTSYMYNKDTGTSLASNKFVYLYDDSMDNGGRAFKIYQSPVSNDESAIEYSDEVVVGAKDSPVTGFEFTEDNSIALCVRYSLYQDNGKTSKYFIDDQGREVRVDGVYGAQSSYNKIDILREKSWWDTMATLPVGLKLTTRGVRYQLPLFSKIKVTNLIKNQIHYSSGIYQIMSTYDEISNKGYTSTFTLLKVSYSSETSLTASEKAYVNDYYGLKEGDDGYLQ